MNQIIEQNLIDLCIKAATISFGDVKNLGGFSYAKNEYVDWYNKIFHIKLMGNIGEQIELIKRGIAEQKLPKNLMITPHTEPDDLEKYISNSGFRQYYIQYGMAMPITNHDLCNSTHKGIVQLSSEEEIIKWVGATEKAFCKKRDSMLYKLLLKDTTAKFYGLYCDNLLVTTLLLFVKNNIAGIHLVGTIPNYRGKGFGTEITKFALSEAARQNCQFAVLHASEKGKRIYARIGFQEFGVIKHYEYNTCTADCTDHLQCG
jgi:GNAT superfamily N-acetyltransferase